MVWTLSETETNLETAGSVIRELEDLLMFLLLKDHILPEAFEEYKIFPNFKKLIFIFGFVAALIFLCNYFMLCFLIFYLYQLSSYSKRLKFVGQVT